jgi:hypothetical protein
LTRSKKQLTDGKTVVITSGLLRALQDKGIKDIAEITYTDRKAYVKDFKTRRSPIVSIDRPMLIPQIQYLTNDSWEQVSAIDGQMGWPILHEAQYSKGMLNVLVIPENFSDLYRLPAEALNRIRATLGAKLNAQLEGPGNISIYIYDNNTCIIESFSNEAVKVNLLTAAPFKNLTDIVSSEKIAGTSRKVNGGYGQTASEKNVFPLSLKPHSFRVFKFE